MSVEEIFKKHGLTMNAKPKYALYSYDQIINEVEQASKEASEILGFSPENCKIFLYYFKWNLLNLAEKFYDASSAKDFIKKNGIKYILDETLNEDTVTVDECKVCREIKDVAILSCSHLFCFDCWKSYARTAKEKLEDADILPYLTCDFEGCKAPIPETFTLQLFRDPETYHFYQHMIIQSFIQLNPLYKWCPNKSNGCKFAVKTDSSKVEEITCECGFTFCFNCNDLPHSPFPCILIHKWKNVMASSGGIVKKNHGTTINLPQTFCFNCLQCNNDINSPLLYGTVSCAQCKNVSDFRELMYAKSTFMGCAIDFEVQNSKLKTEFQELSELEKLNDESLEFLKTALKFLHNFRQKSLYFYAFCYCLENGQIFTKFQSDLLSLLNSATALMSEFFVTTSNYSMTQSPLNATTTKPIRILKATPFSAEKEMEMLDILLKIQIQLESQLKSFYEDDWKFRDKEIEIAMAECKY